MVKAGVVDGSFFDVMGLRPVLGRLLNAAGRWAERGGHGGAHLPLLDDDAQQRPGASSERRFGSAPPRDHRRRAGTVGAVSRRHRDHREHRNEPASSGRDDEDQPHAPDDGAVRTPRAWRDDRIGARRARGRARGDRARASRGLSREIERAAARDAAARSDCRAGADDPAGAARRGRASCSSSRARTSRT